jgi:hypothetical protein
MDEDTALVVDGDGNMEVVGTNGASIFDLSLAQNQPFAYDEEGNVLFPLPLFNLFGVSMDYLTEGDKWVHSNPKSSRFIPAKNKVAVKDPNLKCPPSNLYNIFGKEVFLNIAQQLNQASCNQTMGYSLPVPSSPLYVARMTKQDSTKSFRSAEGALSFQNLVIDFFPSYYVDDTLGD